MKLRTCFSLPPTAPFPRNEPVFIVQDFCSSWCSRGLSVPLQNSRKPIVQHVSAWSPATNYVPFPAVLAMCKCCLGGNLSERQSRSGATGHKESAKHCVLSYYRTSTPFATFCSQSPSPRQCAHHPPIIRLWRFLGLCSET
jgi:hypothetical protein